MPRHDTTVLPSLLAAQAGAIARSQLLAAGVSRRALEQSLSLGIWRRLVPGVYLATPTPTWRTYAWAGVLCGGPQAVVGGVGSLHLHGLVDEPALPILVQTPRQSRCESQPWWMFCRTSRRGAGSPPRSRVEAALLDAWPELTLDAFTATLGKAVADRRTTLPRVRAELLDRARISRRPELAEIIGDVAVGVRSALERAYLREVERPHDLPVGERQIRTRSGIVDVLLRQWGTVIELDGRRGHTGEGAFRDMRRDNAHTLQGAASLRYGWSDVRGRPCAVAAEVAALLQLRGWEGIMALCPHCEGQRRTA